jgi:uncharacterized protein YqeY
VKPRIATPRVSQLARLERVEEAVAARAALGQQDDPLAFVSLDALRGMKASMAGRELGDLTPDERRTFDDVLARVLAAHREDGNRVLSAGRFEAVEKLQVLIEIVESFLDEIDAARGDPRRFGPARLGGTER